MTDSAFRLPDPASSPTLAQIDTLDPGTVSLGRVPQMLPPCLPVLASHNGSEGFGLGVQPE